MMSLDTVFIAQLLRTYVLLFIPSTILVSLIADILKNRKIGLLACLIASLSLVSLSILLSCFKEPITFSVLGIPIYIDLLSKTYMLLAGIIGAAVFIHVYFGHVRHDERFMQYTLLSLVVFTTGLLVVVNNWLLFILLWESVSFLAYYMIMSSRAQGSSYVYYITIHVGGLLLLLGAASLYSSGDLYFAQPQGKCLFLPFVFITIGFIAKAGVFPFHFWVQKVYEDIEPIYAGLFSSIIDGLGIYGLFRIIPCIETYGILYIVLFIVGLVNIVASSIWYWGLRRLSSIMAWSTIYNMGWLLLLCLSSPYLGIDTAAQLLSLYLLSHGFAKAAVFMVINQYGEEHSVLRTVTPRGALLLSLSILAVEGVPPFSLFIAKVALLRTVFAYTGLLAIIPLAAWIASSVFFFKLFGETMFPRTGNDSIGGKTLSSSCASDIASSVLLVLSMFSYLIVIIMMNGLEVPRLW